MKKALTVGELLITMTIIGVIAVLVLPGFMKDYHNKLYVTKLKKVYEMIDTAMNAACVDNNVSYFDQTQYAKFVSGGKNQQAFIDKYFKKATTDNTNPFSAKYKVLNTGAESAVALYNSGFAKLAGGEAISFYCQWNDYCVFRVDVNSTEGPNVGGRDMFMIAVDITKNELGKRASAGGKTYSPATCGNEYRGEGCLEKILQNNWEMKY